jgi:hypothetical protein
MPAVADIHANEAELSAEDGMSVITFHVVCALVEVAYTGDVVLPVLTNVVAVVPNHHSSVPDGVPMLFVTL